MEPGIKKTAVLCIIRSDDSLLLLRRHKDPHLGKYIPIGGKLEPFETPRAAALREITEETGLVLSEVKLQGVMTETSPTPFNWVNFIYVADTGRFVPPDCDEGELYWVPRSEIESLPTPTTDRFIYELVAKGHVFLLNAEYDADLNLVLLENELTGAIEFAAAKSA